MDERGRLPDAAQQMGQAGKAMLRSSRRHQPRNLEYAAMHASGPPAKLVS